MKTNLTPGKTGEFKINFALLNIWKLKISKQKFTAFSIVII